MTPTATTPSPAALITGGARRVGRAIAFALARGGCDIAIHYRSSLAQADSTAEEIRSMGRRAALVQGDLDDPQSWRRIIDETVNHLGRLDILINNASRFDPRPAAQRNTIPEDGFDAGDWERMFRVNATAPVALCHFARSHLHAGGRGRIVNLCDISAERPWPGYLSYCSSKAALVAATKGLARAFAPTITVNGISPGIAVFPEEYPDSLRRQLVARVPLQREGTPEEVAALVRWLVETGDYVTGQIIAIDGGRSLA